MSKTAPRTVRTEQALTTELDTKPRREWLTEAEVELIIRHASDERDKLMILMAFTHGMRVSELINLQWCQVDLEAGRIRVLRRKLGDDSAHPLRGREIRALRRLRRAQPVGSRHVFLTRLGGPMTRNAFHKRLVKAAAAAGIDDVHPHLLRHGCGFKLVNQGMDTISLAAYLGHRNVQNTKHYAKMSSARFDGLWKD
jgi:integrase